jgi:hypothetical protein
MGRAARTTVTDQVDHGTSFQNAESMVLHARTPPDVSQHEDLIAIKLGRRGRLVSGGEDGHQEHVQKHDGYEAGDAGDGGRDGRVRCGHCDDALVEDVDDTGLVTAG